MGIHPWALLIALPPFLAAIWLASIAKHEESRKRDPFNEPLRRPPGESCRRELNKLDEKVINRLLVFTSPILFALVAMYAPPDVFLYVFFFLISTGLTFSMAVRLSALRGQIMNYELGFAGERAVGQELNQALSLGYHVYHDIEYNGYNIDHVVIAPSGIYSVETKTRSKGHGKKSQIVKYDGKKLIFPSGNEDVDYLEQAQRNAKSFSSWINKVTGQRIWVEPVLTFPGWYVEVINREKVAVHVMNPKQITKFVSDRPNASISAETVRLICYQLDKENVVS